MNTPLYKDPEMPAADNAMSVREARKARRMWEDEQVRKMLAVGLDPELRFGNRDAARYMVYLLTREEGIITNPEIADALGYPSHINHAPGGKRREYMNSGYTMKVSVGGGVGGKERVFSKQGACLIAMISRTEQGAAVRGWMAEVIAMAARHPDFQHLFLED